MAGRFFSGLPHSISEAQGAQYDWNCEGFGFGDGKGVKSRGKAGADATCGHQGTSPLPGGPPAVYSCCVGCALCR